MICNTANALRDLFSRCKHDLSAEQLEWFDGLTDCASYEADNLAATLAALALLHGHKGSVSALPDAFGLSDILFGLADRASAIAALVHIGSESAYLANEKRQSEKQDRREKQSRVTPALCSFPCKPAKKVYQWVCQ